MENNCANYIFFGVENLPRRSSYAHITGELSMDIRGWLQLHNMAKYTDLFLREEIDMVILPHITEQDLEKIGVDALVCCFRDEFSFLLFRLQFIIYLFFSSLSSLFLISFFKILFLTVFFYYYFVVILCSKLKLCD